VKSRITAVLLCFFLGLIGIHKFYLNQNGTGIVYLLLSITGIGLIVTLPLTLIDFIALLLTSDENFNEKFNKRKEDK